MNYAKNCFIVNNIDNSGLSDFEICSVPLMLIQGFHSTHSIFDFHLIIKR